MVEEWRGLFVPSIRGPDDAVAFVEALGFCTWGPVPGLPFPNLADAMGLTATGVLDQTWFWKDDLHVERRVYYAKIVRGQPTFVHPDLLPDFVAALAGGPHARERDARGLYEDGRLSRQAHAIVAYLTEHPEQPTRELRRGLGLRERARSANMERALTELQRRFLVCKTDITGRTRGTYSYVWDLADRFWPEAFEEAARTAVGAARARIRERLRAFGIEPSPELERRLFLWQP